MIRVLILLLPLPMLSVSHQMGLAQPRNSEFPFSLFLSRFGFSLIFLGPLLMPRPPIPTPSVACRLALSGTGTYPDQSPQAGTYVWLVYTSNSPFLTGTYADQSLKMTTFPSSHIDQFLENRFSQHSIRHCSFLVAPGFSLWW